MPRPPSPGSPMTSTAVKEARPVWCSPGNPRNGFVRAAKGAKPLGELKWGNRAGVPNGSGPTTPRSAKAQKLPSAQKEKEGEGEGEAEEEAEAATEASSKENAVDGVTGRAHKPKGFVRHVMGANGVQLAVHSGPILARANRAAALKDETPPRSRPLKKPMSAIVTPTNKARKPVGTFGTPKGSVSKGSSPGGRGAVPGAKGYTPKQASPSARRTEADAQGPEAIHSSREGRASKEAKERSQQQKLPSPAWGSSGAARGARRPSPTHGHGRGPIKHLFLSPQSSKRTPKRDPFLRKSIERAWAGGGPVPSRGRSAERTKNRDPSDAEAPLPPAQPTNSPELPKRGSREALGEGGARGFFGAGPMVVPEGLGGGVRDRRKCKPRGALTVNSDGLSMDSDSSAAVESSSAQIPLASVEWMMNTAAAAAAYTLNASHDDDDDADALRSSRTLHDASSTSFSEFVIRENQLSEAFPGEERDAGHELLLRHLRQSRPGNCDGFYYRHAQRSQAVLELLRQSYLSRESGPQSSLYSSRDALSHSGAPDEDIPFDWRKIPPSESMELTGYSRAHDLAGSADHLARSSISFTSSWVRPPESSRSGTASGTTGGAMDSFPWGDVVSNTPEFHRTALHPPEEEGAAAGRGGGAEASTVIGALVANSVRRRIMSAGLGGSNSEDDGPSSPGFEDCLLVNSTDSASFLSLQSSLETPTAAPSARLFSSPSEMDRISVDMSICQTASPMDQAFGEDSLCRTSSPIDEALGWTGDDAGGSTKDRSAMTCSADSYVGCSTDCSVEAACFRAAGDEALESGDDVEYASPTVGDYLSPEKSGAASSDCQSRTLSELTSCVDLVTLLAKRGPRSSMARTYRN